MGQTVQGRGAARAPDRDEGGPGLVPEEAAIGARDVEDPVQKGLHRARDAREVYRRGEDDSVSLPQLGQGLVHGVAVEGAPAVPPRAALAAGHASPDH